VFFFAKRYFFAKKKKYTYIYWLPENSPKLSVILYANSNVSSNIYWNRKLIFITETCNRKMEMQKVLAQQMEMQKKWYNSKSKIWKFTTMCSTGQLCSKKCWFIIEIPKVIFRRYGLLVFFHLYLSRESDGCAMFWMKKFCSINKKFCSVRSIRSFPFQDFSVYSFISFYLICCLFEATKQR